MTTAQLDLAAYSELPDSVATEERGTDTSEREEERLVERLRRAEPAAVGLVYDLHHAAVRALARRLVGDMAAAEDLVHEVFVTLPAAMRRYRRDAPLRTFLLSIAINHARHHLRAAMRRRAALERLGREPGAESSNPEAQARTHELARALTRALDQLPLEQRAAFVLCEVEERTSTDAAVIVGVPEATIRTRLFHARRKLRDALKAEAHG